MIGDDPECGLDPPNRSLEGFHLRESDGETIMWKCTGSEIKNVLAMIVRLMMVVIRMKVAQSEIRVECHGTPRKPVKLDCHRLCRSTALP